MHFPDNRAKFAGTAPWDVANIKDSIRAVRGSPPSDGFRVTTQEIPPQTEEPAQPIEAEQAPNAPPSEADISLDPPQLVKPLPLDPVEPNIIPAPDDTIA